MNKRVYNGKTITFYSYKGGVGRSMAVVNIGCLMAKKGLKVLMLDWDLEAPGLDTFFTKSLDKQKEGLLDFMTKANTYEFEKNAGESEYETFLNENLSNYIQTNVSPDQSNITLDFITAGKFDVNYSERLNTIDWLKFYEKEPAFFRTFAQFLEKQYDYILIDARTGLADTSGICTMLMPQILITVFSLNKQNIEGVIKVAKQCLEYRFDSNDVRNLTILPLPSRIDNDSSSQVIYWQDVYTKEFEKLFKEEFLLDDCSLEAYFNKFFIPYKSEYAYGENIPVLKEKINNEQLISYRYNEFFKLIQENISSWEVLSEEQKLENQRKADEIFREGIKYISENKYEEAKLSIEKAILLVPNNPYNFFDFAYDLDTILSNEDEKKTDFLTIIIIELYQKAIELKPDFHEAYNNWGTYLGDLAKTKTGIEAEDLYLQAFEKLQKATEIKPDLHEAYNNWGTDLGNLANTKTGNEAEELYLQAFEKFKKAIEIKPDDYEAYYNWGTYLGNLAKTKTGIEAEDLYLQAFEKLQKAIEINPDYHEALNNWGNNLGNLAKTKTGIEAEVLYIQAFEKYQKATEIKPDLHESFHNWGNNLGNLAKTKTGIETEVLYIQAFEKYQKATEIKPDLHESFHNWGTTLGDLAKTKTGIEAEELYIQAFEKFQKAIELKPDFHEAFYNWGTYLGDLAKTKTGIEAEDLYLQAFEKFKKAIEQGGISYNLSCLYAIRGEKEKALETLEISLSKNEISTDFVEKDDEDWKNYLEDKDFIALVNKYKS
jgi:tetratricopeptide (TPR) repeat protein